MHRGYFKFWRKLLHSDLWLSEKFSRGQAWVDLVGLANHKDGYIRVRGNRVEIPRGTVGWSAVRLGKRWRWSRGKVARFLDELETEQQIVQQKNAITSLIKIIKWDDYQGNGQQTGQPETAVVKLMLSPDSRSRFGVLTCLFPAYPTSCARH